MATGVGANAPEAMKLKERIQALAASIHAAESELVDMLTELDDCDGWRGLGMRSMSHWLTVRCGFTRHEANTHERLSGRREELPKLYSEFDRGALSVGFMGTAEQVATPENDAKIARIATTATAPQAAKTFASFRAAEKRRSDRNLGKNTDDGVRPPETPGADDVESVDPIDKGLWLQTWWDEHEHLRVNARLDTTDGATLISLLEQLRIRDKASAGSAEPDGDSHRGSPEEGRASTRETSRFMTKTESFSDLLRLAGDALTNSGVRNRWTERFAITVNVDLDVLAGIRDGRATLIDGTPIDAQTVRDWMVGARIQGLLSDRGRPLDMGRTVRTATPSQLRALLARDKGCAFPGCCRTDHLDAHHVKEWVDGGLTDIDNLVLLCRRHHRLLHRGEFAISMNSGLPVIKPDPTTGRCGHWSDGSSDRQPAKLDEARRQSSKRGDAGHAGPDAMAAHRGGETLTSYALDVWVSSLLAAA